MTKLEAAQAAFEDAASRGFSDRNQGQLQYEVEVARIAETAVAPIEAITPLPIPGEVVVVETKTYLDGTEATGVAPLPEQSPAEQLLDAAAAAATTGDAEAAAQLVSDANAAAKTAAESKKK